MAEEPDENRKAGYAYAAGITLFASVVSFCALGWLVDRWFGTQPWFLIGGLILGSAAGLFEFIRLSSKTF
ncbi:MAG TPA: AtpZ/AtpI family protein [Pyrinomonadaceae bacterium]|jgi:ATP synthase protein I|nr:AtpZ/AtpI family protein [Pyrinomonadaceae bacterium]